MDQHRINYATLRNFTLSSYYCRKSTTHGGVAIFTSNDLSAYSNGAINSIATDLYLECCASEVTDGKQTYLFVCLYRSPLTAVSEFLLRLEELLVRITNRKITTVLGGDFNIDFIGSDSESRKLRDLLHSHGAQILFNEPSRSSRRCIDNVLIFNNGKTELLATETKMTTTGFSDHKALTVAFVDPAQCNINQYREGGIFNENKMQQFIHDLSSQTWNEVYLSSNPNEQYNHFINTFSQCYNSYFPLTKMKTRFNNKQKTYPPEILDLRNQVSLLQTISLYSIGASNVFEREFQVS